MKQKVEIEYKDANGEYDYIDVVFEAEPEWDNDSYSDEYGKVILDDYPVLNDNPTWDESLHTEEENKIIKKWSEENWKELSDKFCSQFVKDQKTYI